MEGHHCSEHGIEATYRSLIDEDFEVAELEAAPGAVAASMRGERAAIRLTLRGEVTESTAYGSYRFTAGTLDYRPAGFAYSEVAGAEGCSFVRIAISDARMTKIALLFERPDRPFLQLTSQFGDLPSRIVRELRASDRFSALSLKAAVLELIAHASRLVVRTRATAPPRWLIDAQQFMEQNLRTQMALSDVAAAVGCDATWLAKSYKRFFGCTVGEGIRSLRVAEAARLLQTTRLPVIQIASLAGFCDASHMIHSFHAVHGMSPTQFRCDSVAGAERAAASHE